MDIHPLNAKPASFSSELARYQAFTTRNADADGCFVIAVKTTRIYCRPICPARPPKRENICFYDTVAQAKAAGFRACLRCKPDGPTLKAQQAQIVTQACRAIELNDPAPSIATLARDAGYSAGRFHRIFKEVTGLSPKQYASAKRVQNFQKHLKSGASVTTAIYDAGFNASSRAYDASRRLGARPSDIKSGGVALHIRAGAMRCSLGYVGIGMSERGLCALVFGSNAREALEGVRAHFPKAVISPAPDALDDELQKVVHLVDQQKDLKGLPLDIRGTAFQERVWQALRDIPKGSTRSYADIAEQIGKPSAYRAVAQACGANKIAVAVPCHRVIASDGTLGGYAFGVERKRALLNRERKGGGSN